MSLFFKRSLLAVVLLAAVMPAAADTLVLQGGEDMVDTYLDAGTVMGASDSLQIGNAQWLIRTIMQFDLSDIPANAVINSASLQFNVWYQQVSVGNPVDLEACFITAEWDEAFATKTMRTETEAWATERGDYTTTGSIQYDAKDPRTAFDITSMVQAWVDGTQVNYGLMLKFQTEDTDGSPYDPALNVYMRSSEAGSTTQPVLTIDYTVVPEPATMSLLGLGSLGMLLRRKR